MCEVALESAPQLMTQWAFVMFQQAYSDLTNFSVSPLQQLSITTSTIAIVFSIISYITQNRRVQWIYPGFPPAASLLPMGCLTLSAVLSGSVSLRLIVDVSSIMLSEGPFFDLTFCTLIINFFSMLFTIFFIIMSHSACYNRLSIKITRTAIQMCLSGILPACLIYNLATESDAYELERYRRWNIFTTFVISLLCQILHFLLGIIIFSGLNYARLFSPIIFALVSLVRSIADCCCPQEWRYHINVMLDEVVKPERENQIVGSEQERGKESKKPNQVTARLDYVTEISEFCTECV